MDIEKGRIARIRELNDAFRRTFSGGRVMLTCGVDALPDLIKARALQLVASSTSSVKIAEETALLRDHPHALAHSFGGTSGGDAGGVASSPSGAAYRNLLANLKRPIDFTRFSTRSILQLTRHSRRRAQSHND
jgi:hypothetical protein